MNRRLLDPGFDREGLVEVLSRQAALYDFLDSALNVTATPPYVPRLPLIRESLAALQATALLRPLSGPIPSFATDPSRWGARYVVEGAAMGGQMIHARLSATFPPKALAFFVPHGDDTGIQWRRFRDGLEQVLVTEGSLLEAEAAAKNVFAMFARMLA